MKTASTRVKCKKNLESKSPKELKLAGISPDGRGRKESCTGSGLPFKILVR